LTVARSWTCPAPTFPEEAVALKPAVVFLSAAQVVEMHDRLLERWGGHPGGGHRGASYEGVEAAVPAVKNSYYDTLEELAAAYAVYIVQGHVFMDGNKRTGAATMLCFLEFNGLKVRCPLLEVVESMLELQRRAERGEDVGRLVSWLAEMLRNRRRSR
jgi:death-on-curing protein